MRFSPKPSRRVKIATVIAASSERPKESSRPERLVHLIKRPPVLQIIAAARTSSNGDEAGLAAESGKLVFGRGCLVLFVVFRGGVATLQIFTEDTVPGRNHYGNGALCLGLTGQTN